MPWEKKDLETMRKEFVERVLSREKSKSALCREYGISRPTGDKWIARYLAGAPLSDEDKRPHSRPNQTAAILEAEIVEYRKKYPAIGAVKLHRMMQNEGKSDLPCSKTFNNIFKRNGLIRKEASEAATPYKRYEKEAPNIMWQADYKGHFALQNGGRCHPLNIVDDCSRFNLCSEAQASETFREIKPVMLRLFEEYGLPFSFLCDNGNPWGTAQTQGYTSFEVWMMELGILVLHGRARHPQTQGKDESFNRSLTREYLRGRSFLDMADAQRGLNEYRGFYNNKRPHHALNLEVPAAKYQPSLRRMPQKVEPWEYPADCELRTVKDTGYLHYSGSGLFLSEAFAGKTVAVRPSHLPGQITILFRQFKIARFDCETRCFTMRRAYLQQNDPRIT